MMKFEVFEGLLKLAKNQKQLDDALKAFLKSYNITTFSFTYYNFYPNSHHKTKYDFCSPNFSIWHQHYISEGYEEVDSTLESVYQTNLPIFWDLNQQLNNSRTIKERQMRLDSLKFGAEMGLSIPIHGPHEDFAILLLVQMKGEKCLKNWKNLQYYFFTAANYYYFYLKQKITIPEKKKKSNVLSMREIQCLKLIEKQFTTKNIAAELNITERTVNFHIQKLNKKLGTKNKYLSVIKASQKNLLTD